jgi:hypothetical protein
MILRIHFAKKTMQGKKLFITERHRIVSEEKHTHEKPNEFIVFYFYPSLTP